MISEHADPLARPGSKEVGGQNVYVYNLARALSKIGWEVDVFTRWDNPNKQRVIKFAQRARVIRVKSGPRHYIPRDELYKFLPDFVDDVVSFKKENNLNYDLIHTHYWMSGWCGLKISSLWDVPMVATYHSLGYVRFHTLKAFKKHSPDNDFFRKRISWEKKIAQLSDSVLSTSPYEREDITKYYGVSSHNIAVIPAGIDAKTYYPINKSVARRTIQRPADEKIVLYVGRIEWRKGIGTLISALAKVIEAKKIDTSNLKLLIVGRTVGPEKKEVKRLKQLAQHLGIAERIIYTGSKDASQLRHYYSAADVCVVPSYYEPFGIVPLEAMACGTPVIASKVGGLRYTVKNKKAGLLVPPRNPKGLSRAINNILGNEDHYIKSVSQYARDVVLKEFVWPAVAKEASNLYKKIINKRLTTK
ncbi:MAG: glycosyltransferase [Patescibacteria group bacterium]